MLLLFFTLYFFSCFAQKKVEESNTGALLKFPSVIDGPLFTMEWEVSPAQFGYQSYGGSLEAYLVLPMNTTYHTECPDINTAEPIDKNEYIHLLRDSIDVHRKYGFIFIIDRGDCYFVQKVEHAQKLGAKAVIILDHTPENLFTMWMPDNWNDDIDIPSVLLQEQKGEILMRHLGVQNWNPKDVSGTIFPDIYNYNWTLATIEWGLPHDDDRVEWELWTSSNDPLAVPFKHNFKPISLILDGANDTVFEPRMYILNGTHWGCDDYPTLRCGNQCTNQGRYCSVDPEYDLENGVSGIDVVQENLRNLCVWNYTKYQDLLQHNLNESDWWDYAVMWDSNCAFYNGTENKFTEQCSFEQMNIIDPTKKLKNYVVNCIINSGGYGYNDSVNNILENEVYFREHNGVYAMPMVRVNEFLIHGNIDCDILVPSHCQVLAAICAGFINGTKPEICYGTHFPSISPTLNPTTMNPTFNPSLKPTKSPVIMGCNGKVGSNERINPCGVCIDKDDPSFNIVGKDCSGICYGNKEKDRCGKCLDPNDEEFDSCIISNNDANKQNSFASQIDLPLIIVLAIIVLFVVILAIFCWFRMKKRTQSLENKLSQLAGSYQFMDESTNVNVNTNDKQTNSKKKMRIAVEDDDAL